MTPKVPDYGHREADKELFALIRRLHLSYRQASIGLHKKIEKYLEDFEKEDAMYRALYDSGEMSHEAFIKWRRKMITDTKAWRDMLEQLSDDMTHQNQIAASMIDDTLPGVYALNHNYGTYEAEKGSGYDTTYTLYDKNTVKRLLTEHEDLLPRPSVPVEKDKLWNKQHLQSAVLQGILTGEPMSDIAKRFQSVTDMTERAAMRNARTAVTGAENAGRIDSYIRAQNMGIKMKQMWMATLDGRTRDSHAMMDGEQQEVGKEFSNGCRYPGDPNGAPAECYNCRCTLVAIVEGADPYNPNLRPSEYLKEEGLTYEQWKEMHGERFYSKLFSDKNTEAFESGQKEKSTASQKQQEDVRTKLQQYNDEIRKVNDSITNLESEYSEAFPNSILSFGTENYDVFNKRLEEIEKEIRQQRDKAEAIESERTKYLSQNGEEEIISAYGKIKGKHNFEDDVNSVNTITEDIRTQKNCGSCVLAYDARRRDIDCKATLTFGTTNIQIEQWWSGLKMRSATSYYPSDAKNEISQIAVSWGNGARGIVEVGFTQTSGHYFAFEVIDGKCVFIDPQTGSTNSDYIFDAVMSGTVKFARTDDKQLTKAALLSIEGK